MIDFKAFARGTALCLTALVLFTGIALAAGPQSVWTARLGGRNEVPPNDSKAHGAATFRIVWGNSVGTDVSGRDSLAIDGIEYRVRVSNLNDLTAGHIHIGAEGVAGPDVVNLYPRTGPGRSTGVIAQGTITAADLTGPLTGMTLWDLYALFVSGGAYVNLHTTAYPGGEIRGQIGSRGGR